MISKNQIKLVRSLHQKKFRDSHGLFIVEGPKLVAELLQSAFEVEFMYAVAGWQAPVDIPVNQISEAELERISTLKKPNQVLAVAKIPQNGSPKLDASELALVLDDVKDPGNLGTIIRTADWFGINTIYCSKNTVELYNPKVAQSTMGSLFRMQVISTDLQLLLNEANEQLLPVYGAVLGGDDLYEVKTSDGGLLVMGSESHGISEDLRAYLNQTLTIPAYGEAESLNVAVATGIILAALKQ